MAVKHLCPGVPAVFLRLGTPEPVRMPCRRGKYLRDRHHDCLIITVPNEPTQHPLRKRFQDYLLAKQIFVYLYVSVINVFR